MAYREVTMLEVKEVLRLWLAGVPKKRIAVQLGLDVKTVRRYIGAAWARGLAPRGGARGAGRRACSPPSSGRSSPAPAAPMATAGPSARPSAPSSSAHLQAGRAAVQDPQAAPAPGRRASATRPSGASRWPSSASGAHRADDSGRRLRARRRGPARHGLDDAPGARMPRGRRRRFRAWIFTAVLSRYRFVYPVFRETTETAIEACEAAWAFFHGRLPRPDPRQHEGDRPAGGSAGAAAQSHLPRVRPGARLRHRPHARAPRPGQGPRRAGRAQRPRRLLRRRGAGRSRGRARAHARHWCLRGLRPRATAGRSAPRGSTSRPSSSRRSARRRRRRTTSRSGATRRSLATSTPRSPAALYSLPTAIRRPDPASPRRPDHRPLLRRRRLRQGPPADAPGRPRLRPHRLPR